MALDFTTSAIGNPKTDTFDINKGAEMGSSLVSGMNQAVTEMFGVNVAYFRAVPNKNSTDFIYMNYTLLNVDECPTEIKLLFKDAGYAAGDYSVNFYEMNYNVPLEVQIDAMTWFKAFGPGTMPQRYDILYVPIIHKVFEVDSTNQVFGFMEQLTHFNLVLKKYNPKESRRESENLTRTLDHSTTSISELFGGKISTEVADIVDSNQTDPYNSTSLDDYKFIKQDRVSILEENGKSFYRFNHVDPQNKSVFDVEYKVGMSIDFAVDGLLLTSMFRYADKSSNANIKVKSIKPVKRYVDKDIDTIPIQLFEIDCNVNQVPDLAKTTLIKTDTDLQLRFFEVKDNKLYCYVRYVDFINHKEDILKITTLFLSGGVTQSIFSGFTNGSINFNLVILNSTTLALNVNNVETKFELNKHLSDSKWYGLSLMLDPSTNLVKLNLYSVSKFQQTSNIRKFTSSESNFDFKKTKDLAVSRFGLIGSYLDISNTRLYQMPLDVLSKNTEKEIKLDLTSQVIRNNSYTIVNDDCLIPANKLNNIFVGKHK